MINNSQPWRPLQIGIILGLTGFAANWFKIDLFFDLQFLCGSCAAMLAILSLGGRAGSLAALLASLCTWILWKHPWAIVIMTLEGVCVSLLYRRKIRNIVVCDLVYWLLAGAPLVFLFYHEVMGLQTDRTLLIFLKQAVNGIFNALVASVLHIGWLIWRRKNQEGLNLRHFIFTALVSAVLAPALLIMAINLKVEKSEELSRLAAKTDYLCDTV